MGERRDTGPGRDPAATADGLRRLACDVSYRMLGSRADAEDVAQEALARVLPRVERGEITNPAAFVTTVATRLSLDELKSARRRREQYVGPWLPEPRVEWSPDPVETADELSYALLVVLDALTPLERAAYLLRDVFAFDYDEIGEAIGRAPAASRQLVSRARRHIRHRRPTRPTSPAKHRHLLERFVAAARDGDTAALVEMLADDVQLVSDGGATRKAARYPIAGRTRVARFVAKVFPRLVGDGSVEAVTVNGEAAYGLARADGLHLVGVLDHDGDRITRLCWMLNPDKLPRTAPPAHGTGATATPPDPSAG